VRKPQISGGVHHLDGADLPAPVPGVHAPHTPTRTEPQDPSSHP
jgi:hypothetical protein